MRITGGRFIIMDQAEQLRNIIKGNTQNKRPLARVITVTSGKGWEKQHLY